MKIWRREINCERFLLLSLISVLLMGCAAQAPPGGGPPDRSPPELLSISPEPGSTHLNGIHQVVFTFDEDVLPESVQDRLRISPSLSGELNFRVKKNRLLVTFPAITDTENTYILILGAGVKDLRGNATEKEFVTAFSAGSRIDMGRISGEAFGIANKKMVYEAYLYRIKEVLLDSLLWREPDYRVRITSEGSFAFNYLPSGLYRLIGYAHPEGYKRMRPSELMAGLPVRDPILVKADSPEPARVKLIFHKFNLEPVNIVTALQTEQGYLELVCNKPIASNFRTKLFLKTDKGSITHIWRDKENPASLILRFAGVKDDSLQLLIGGLTDSTGSVNRDTLKVNVFLSSLLDTISPELKLIEPGRKNYFLPLNKIRFLFSEPVMVDTLEKLVYLYQDDSIQVPLKAELKNDLELVLELSDSLRWGTQYRLQLEAFRITDFSGNVYEDSTVVYKLATQSLDRLGSISGSVTGMEIKRGFTVIAGKKDGIFRGAACVIGAEGDFQLPYLLAGSYHLVLYQDKNGDGQYDYGYVEPFRCAEPFWIYNQEVSVRARWETAGILLSQENLE